MEYLPIIILVILFVGVSVVLVKVSRAFRDDEEDIYFKEEIYKDGSNSEYYTD